MDRGLAACVNIFPGMTSIYVWEGKRQRDTEAAMIIKTRAHLADAVDRRGAQAAPLHQPGAAWCCPSTGGSEDFLRWIAEQTAVAGQP